MKAFWKELVRRRVTKFALAYAAFAWFVWESAQKAQPHLAFPPDFLFWVKVTLGACAVPALALSWYFDVRVGSITRTPPAPTPRTSSDGT